MVVVPPPRHDRCGSTGLPTVTTNVLAVSGVVGGGPETSNIAAAISRNVIALVSGIDGVTDDHLSMSTMKTG
jgi:hypothetical protein